MKKTRLALVALLVMALLVAVFATGCSNQSEPAATEPPAATETPTEEPVSYTHLAITPGTPQPEPISMGMKLLPERPNLRKMRSMMKAIREMCIRDRCGRFLKGHARFQPAGSLRLGV